jgi:hypothetical protein
LPFNKIRPEKERRVRPEMERRGKILDLLVLWCVGAIANLIVGVSVWTLMPRDFNFSI